MPSLIEDPGFDRLRVEEAVIEEPAVAATTEATREELEAVAAGVLWAQENC